MSRWTFISVHGWPTIKETAVKAVCVFFLQLWIKEQLDKKADNDSGPVAQIGEHFILLTCFILSVDYVCQSACMYVCQTITFERLDVGTSYLHIRYTSRQYRSSSFCHFTSTCHILQ